MRTRVLGWIVPLVALVPGCRTVGPDYRRPEPAAPAAFKHAAPPANATPAVPAGEWWRVFGDPELDRLATAALSGSPSLAAAVARVDEARARLGGARADTQVLANAGGSARLVGESAERVLPLPGRPVTYRETGDAYRASVDAGYELDLWGRVKRTLEGVEAQIVASEADRQAVGLVLTAEVAQAYLGVRTLDGVAAVLARTLASRREAVELLRVRFAAGLAPELDPNRAQVEVATLEADIADVRRRREQLLNALALLVGQAPAELAALGPGTDVLRAPPSVPAGLPSDLLRRRPDIAASEALLRVRTAEIGVAEAARFPTIRLTGSAGFESADLGRLLGRPSQFWQLGPSVSVPLLEGGRVQAGVTAAQARLAAAAADYRQRGLTAFREVEDALVELRENAAQAEALTRAAGAATTVLELATLRQARGFATYLEVIEAQRTRLQIERAQVEIAGARFAGTVRLIRALGGGWQ
jgi:multidrug efflux system outer membrane protein